ncbi:alpha/beta hydrolase [Verrucomicrobia bacterium]|nr:alpha/beta hydrolase [Verrucomicrobiota bacterium]MDB4798366.1 alpha/beta hydrolase [Verrucomicrobiota bacterium]
MNDSKSTYCLLTAFLTVVSVALTAQAQQGTAIPAITFENVSYGDHPNQVIDFRKADVEGPVPLVIFIHGGGFRAGSHDKVSGKKIQQYHDAGIHHASIEYRFLQHARFPAQHEDCVRALQFIRSKADEWGVDKERIAAYGGSAGAQLVAYLAWGNDFADPDSDDPISRESSRLTAVAPVGGQSTLDMDWWVENIPGYNKNFHGKGNPGDLSAIEQRAVRHEISIINHISSDDPPTFMSYGMNPGDQIPSDPKRARGWSIHHVNFGIAMEKELRREGVEAFLKYPQAQLPFEDDVAFLIHHLKK